MFTGIVKGLFKTSRVESKNGLNHIEINLNSDFIQKLEIGASIAVNGTCLTVVELKENLVGFDVIHETLTKTTLGLLKAGQLVNIERAACFGDEIGGHLLSGHVIGVAQIIKIERPEHNQIVTFHTHEAWIKYLFAKGYVAIDGISLTLVNVNADGTFSVHLIPETLRMTTLGFKTEGDFVNIEVDSQTQAIVDTLERMNGRSPLYNYPM